MLQLGIGAWLAPTIRTEDDYLVGGRQFGYPLTILSIFATWFGAETCIASAGRAYKQGIALTTAEPFAYGVTLIAMGLIFAVPLWRRKLTTLADLFRQRYGPGVEKLAAVVLIPSGIAARSPAVARNGAVLAGGLYIIVGILPLFLGLVAGSFIPEVVDAETFLPLLAREMLPAAGYVVFAGALISAILSTVDTILLVGSGLATRNVIAPMLGVTNDRTRLRMARGGVVVMGVVALWLALGASGVAELVEEASSFGSAGVLVVVCFALFSDIGNSVAAVASLVGVLISYVAAGAMDLPYPFITSLVASLALYVAGLWQPNPRRSRTLAASTIAVGPCTR